MAVVQMHEDVSAADAWEAVNAANWQR